MNYSLSLEKTSPLQRVTGEKLWGAGGVTWLAGVPASGKAKPRGKRPVRQKGGRVSRIATADLVPPPSPLSDWNSPVCASLARWPSLPPSCCRCWPAVVPGPWGQSALTAGRKAKGGGCAALRPPGVSPAELGAARPGGGAIPHAQECAVRSGGWGLEEEV